jgi:hypothetical protein
MSGLDNSQPLTDEQSLREGHLEGQTGHPDPAAEQLGKAVREHSEAEAHHQPHAPH